MSAQRMQACSSLQFLTVWAQKHMFTHVIAQEERCGCWATCLQTVPLGELGAVAIVCSHHKQLRAGTLVSHAVSGRFLLVCRTWDSWQVVSLVGSQCLESLVSNIPEIICEQLQSSCRSDMWAKTLFAGLLLFERQAAGHPITATDGERTLAAGLQMTG